MAAEESFESAADTGASMPDNRQRLRESCSASRSPTLETPNNHFGRELLAK